MSKEEVFELIKEASKTLIHTDIIMYPAGSMEKNARCVMVGREISRVK